MSIVRTEVGIVEWAIRVHGVVALHRAVADALGRRLVDAPIGTRYELLDRARRHGWCADEWTTVAPVLHGVDPDSFVTTPGPALDQALADLGREADGTVALEAEAAVAARFVERYRAWIDEAEPIADAPYRHVLDRVIIELAVEDPA